jgi:Domain of unknown function (DUF932)
LSLERAAAPWGLVPVGNVADTSNFKEFSMNNFHINESVSPAYAHAFTPALSIQELQQWAPAIFAESACATTKPTYRFINTAEVLSALRNAGFVPSSAQQTHSRHPMRMHHSRHMIRLRPIRETITLFDCIPEICLVNAHDGTSAYQLLAGLYRPLCTNGLLCRMGDFAVIRIPHRANVIADVVSGAIEITAQFARIGSVVEAMARRILSDKEQLTLAHRAYEIRWASAEARPALNPEKLLTVRRAADDQPTLWHTYNRLQESTMSGGISYHSRTQRLVRTRRIRNIREDVRINTALWSAATQLL